MVSLNIATLDLHILNPGEKKGTSSVTQGLLPSLCSGISLDKLRGSYRKEKVKHEELRNTTETLEYESMKEMCNAVYEMAEMSIICAISLHSML